MPTKTRLSLTALLGLPLLAVAPACAGTVYTDFGIGYANYASYNNGTPSAAFQVTGSNISSQAYAMPFTPTSNYNVTSIDVLIGEVNSTDNEVVDVGIYSDVSGLPGALIGELSTINLGNLAASTAGGQQSTATEGLAYNGTTCTGGTEACVYSIPIVDVSGVTGLVGGTTYFLALGPSSNTTAIDWYRAANFYSNSSNFVHWDESNNFSPTAPNNPNTTWFTGYTTTNHSAAYFDVLGTAVSNSSPPPSSGTPEPATLALLGLGLGAIALQRRRQQRNR